MQLNGEVGTRIILGLIKHVVPTHSFNKLYQSVHSICRDTTDVQYMTIQKISQKQ